MSDLADTMRADWDRRAREDAYYYAAFGRRGQDEAEFEATAADVVRDLERELRHLGQRPRWATLRGLEIGCGPGRVMLPMSRRLAEVHGVDVSSEMVRLAQERLCDAPNAHAHWNNGLDLKAFADDSFDFVYSYAVFQHIPSRGVVFGYLSEVRRVLRAGGLVRCQMNGLPPASDPYNTWHGVRISAAEVAEFALAHDFQLLALEGAGTQYMWATLRKRGGTGFSPSPGGADFSLPRVWRISNAYSSEPLAPCRGRFASVSLWIEGLPEECDLLRLRATIGGAAAKPFYIGPPENDGLRQLNISLPPQIETGLQPILIYWRGGLLCPPVTLRVVPPGPAAPRVVAVSDAVDLLSGTRIRSGIVKLVLEDVEQISNFQVSVDGRESSRIETFCVDPVPARYEVNIYLPPGTGAGEHRLEMWLGRRRLPPVLIETP